ncbi:MAG: MFS transporter, partial [Dehalobacterium sp.]
LSDKIGRKKTLMLMFAVQAVNMLLFINYSTFGLMALGIGVAGIAYGSLLAVFPPLIFEYYGMKNGGVNYAVVFSSWGVGGVCGPIMAGFIADKTGSYQGAFLLAAGLLVISLLLTLALKAPKEATAKESIIEKENFNALEAQKLVKACPAGLYILNDDKTLRFDYAGCLECGTCRVLCKGTLVKEWDYPQGTFGIEYRYG